MNVANFFTHLKNQNLSKVERETGLSRQALHGALKNRNMKLANLTAVAAALGFQVEFTPLQNEENLLGSLARWGVPLAHSKNGSLSISDTVLRSLQFARKDELYESLVPYLIAKNAFDLNPRVLAGGALSMNQVNVLGYFTEMANTYSKTKKLKDLLDELEPIKNSKAQFLVTSTMMHFPELFEKNTIALKWNLKVRGHAEDHFERWSKWDQLTKKN